MSCIASYNGRRYGSILAARSPGKNPKRSPASTAGRVRIIRCTRFICSASTAIATASQLFPVPAGPIPNVTTLSRMASTYRRCPAVFARMTRPPLVRKISSVKIRLGLWFARTITIERMTTDRSRFSPRCRSSVSSSNSLLTSAASAPLIEISLPRT